MGEAYIRTWSTTRVPPPSSLKHPPSTLSLHPRSLALSAHRLAPPHSLRFNIDSHALNVHLLNTFFKAFAHFTHIVSFQPTRAPPYITKREMGGGIVSSVPLAFVFPYVIDARPLNVDLFFYFSLPSLDQPLPPMLLHLFQLSNSSSRA